jgi:small-conductance mechanosensitive channel
MMRLAALLRAATVILLLSLVSVSAQNTQIDSDAWANLAQRAEQAVEAASASSEALEVLRADVAAYRDQWLQIQNAGDPRLQTLQSQLSALGPVPESGEEPAEITQRRAELTQQIATLRAPILRAEEAFTRADGLVAEIDAIIRSRQTDALLERGPEPLDPRLWPEAFSQFGATAGKLGSEVSANWANEVRRREFINDLPATLIIVAFACLLLFRAPRLVARLGTWLRSKTVRSTGVWTTLLSLLRILLPVLGLFLLVQAADVSGLLGDLGSQVSFVLPFALFVVLFTRWLAAQRFAQDASLHAVALAPERRTEARYYANVLSWFLALDILLMGVSDFDNWPKSAIAVAAFPMHVMCGLLLFRLGQILNKASPLAEDEASDASEAKTGPSAFTARLARMAGKVAMLVGILGPIFSGIGYFNVAHSTIFPTILSLGLFATLLTIQNFVKDVYHLVTGRDLATSESLVPVISGIFLSIAALPILALIWGARIADLTELWARFQNGFSFGETRISPIDFLTFAVVFGIGYLVTRLLQGGLRGSVLPKTGIDKGGQTAIVAGTGYVGIFLSAIIAIVSAGIDLSALAIVFGALSVGIGFGLQNIVQNFVSGIILLVERPIAEGDWIEVNGQHGTVREISVRSTRIETFDRTDVIVPNADLIANAVTNYTRGNVLGRLVVDVGVAYGTDTRKVEDILYKIARNHDMVLMNPPPFVHFKGFGADSLDFDVRMILRDITKILAVRTEINHQIYEAFAAEGVDIPFAQRDVWLRNPEVLTGGGAKRDTPSDTSEEPSS